MNQEPANDSMLFASLTLRNLGDTFIQVCEIPTAHISGPVAQLGERLNGIQEVVGSIPIGSTVENLNNRRGFRQC